MGRPTLAARDFGKDHWSLFAYIETRCVDAHIPGGIGELDKRNLRCNEKAHPMNAVNFTVTGPWRPEHGTRLSGYFLEGDKRDPARLLKDHDDWDCMDDLEDAGLIEIMSEANAFVRMTDKGCMVAGRLREWKAKGGYFATFRYDEPARAGV
jgi:hypothetical protein